MAQLYFKVEADYEKVAKLREEITKLESQLKSMGKNTPKETIEELEKSLSSAKSEFKSLAEEAAVSGATLKTMFDSLKAPIAGLAGLEAIKSFVSQVIRIRGEFQEMETSIETLVGSDMKNKLLPQIKELAKVSPLTMTDIVGAEKMMLGFNIEADKTIRFLQALSDVSMGSSQKFNSLTLAFSQMSATGKLMGQDLNQMINAGFNPLQQIAKTTGKSIASLKEEMSKGAISAEMVQQAFIDATSAGGKFYKMSENASKTINGQISMLEDAIDAVFNELGTASESVIVEAISTTTSLIQNYDKIGKVLGGLIATYGTYKASLAVAVAMEKGLTVATIAQTVATKAATVAQAAFNAVAKMNPYVLLATTIVGAVSAIWAFTDKTTQAEREEERLGKRLEENNKLLNERRDTAEKYVAIVTDELRSEKERQDALIELQKLYPNVFKQFNTYIELTDKKTEAQKAFNAELYKEKELMGKADYNADFEALKKLQRLRDIINQNNENRKQGKAKVLSQDKEFKSLVKDVSPYWNGKGDINEVIKNLSASVNKQMKEFREKASAEYESAIKNKTKAQLEADIAEYNKVIELAVSQGKDYIQLQGDDFATSVKELRSRVAKAKEQIKSIQDNADKDFLAEAKKRYEESQKKVKKIIADRNKRSIYPNEEAYKKALETAKKEEEKALKEYKKLGGDPTKDKKDTSEATKKAKQEEKYRQVVAEQHQQNIAQARKNKLEMLQIEIDMEQNASKKRLKQISLDYQKEVAEILEWEDQIKQAKIENARKAFESNIANKGKVFDVSSVDLSLTSDEEALLLAKWNKAYFNHNEALKKVGKDEEAIRAELIRNFGTYAQRVELLEQEHQKRLAEIRKNGGSKNAEDLENAQYKQYLDELNNQFGISIGSFVDLFEDASKKSVNDIQTIINKYKQLLDVLKAKKGKPVSADDLANLGLTEQQIQDIVTGKVSIKDLTDALKDLNRELANKSPFKSFVEDVKEAVEGLKEAKGDTNKMGEAIANIGDAVTAFTPALSKFSSDIASIFGYDDAEIQDVIGAISGLGETASGIGKIMSGDIVGGIMATVSGIANVVGKIKTLSDRDNEKKIKSLQEQIDSLGKSYADLSEEIEKAYSHDAKKLIENQNELLKQQKSLVEQQIQEEESKKKSDKEKIESYKEELADINKTIEDNKAKALDAIFGEDLQTAIENFASAYADAIASGDTAWKSSKDYAKNMMKQMVIESIKAAVSSSKAIEQIRNQLDEFYKDGVLSATEQAWVYEATENAMRDIQNQFGWADDLLSDSATQQSATRKGLESLTQEQGDELNGRFTALQLAGEKMAVDMAEQTAQLTLLNATTADLRQMSENAHNTLSGIADQIAQSYLELQEINENTGQSAKALKAIQADIAEVKNNTAKLV